MILYEKILFPDTSIRPIHSVKGSQYDSIFSSSYNGKCSPKICIFEQNQPVCSMINAKILCWLVMEYCYLRFNLLVTENDGT